jgi:hypothetical protein
MLAGGTSRGGNGEPATVRDHPVETCSGRRHKVGYIFTIIMIVSWIVVAVVLANNPSTSTGY